MNSVDKIQRIQELLKKSHDTKAARSLIDELIRAEPSNVEVWYYRGVCEKFEGDLDLAEKDFRSVIQQKPTHSRALYGLADVLVHKGNLKEAFEAYQRSAALGNKQAAKILAQHDIPPAMEQKAVPFSPQYQQPVQKVVGSNLSLGVELKTERGIDYTQLRDLLATENWDTADRETEKLMLQAGGKDKAKWGATFPCVDLQTIDNLWMYYSKGRFGFTVQHEIWRKRIEGGRKFNRFLWEKFGNYVGWIYKNLWLCKSEISFDDSAPKGHLPVGMWVPLKTEVESSFLARLFEKPTYQKMEEAQRREAGWHGAELIGLLYRLEICNSPNREEIEKVSPHTTTTKKLNDFQILLANPFQALFVYILRFLGYGIMFFVFIIVADLESPLFKSVPFPFSLVGWVLDFYISFWAFVIYQIAIDKLLRKLWKDAPILNDKFSEWLKGIWRRDK